jgi:mono/diheme cytochrome c family protein
MKRVLLFMTIILFGGSILLWPVRGKTAEYEQGKKLYGDNCQICHGADGKGNGPAASALSPKPANFTDPKFWQGDVDKKITHTIEKGHGMMPAFNLNPAKIKDIIDYLTHTFKPKS